MKTTRRNFLKVSALAGGGFAMAIAMPASSGIMNTASAASSFDLGAYLNIDTAGNITFLLTKHEMGQGSGTGLPMILADELGADWSKLTLKRSDYTPKFSGREMGTTGGSSTIMKMWDVLRQAGATTREMFKATAAKRWGVSPEGLQVENGFVVNANGEKLGFGELAEEASQQEIPTDVKLKAPSEFKYIGQPVKNLITDEVVSGKANYGINTEVEGMVYAAIERCPVYKGKLVSFDDTEARKVTGVIDVIPVPTIEPVEAGQHVQEGVAVIATSTWSAFKAKKLLRIEWDNGENGNESIDSLLGRMESPEYTESYKKGEFDKLSTTEGYELVEAEYDNPYQAHALMEPINATAHFKGDSCEVWVGTQSGERVAAEVQKITGLSKEKITVHVLNSGGSFGRRYYSDSSMEVAYLTKVLNKPVKLTWSREDEIAHDYFHPYQRSTHKAIISPDKKVVGWYAGLVRTEEYFTGANAWEIPYQFDHISTETNYAGSIVHVGAWRSVGEHSSSLGKECFIDELAIKLNKDPLELRLELLEGEIVPEGTDDFALRIAAYRKSVGDRYKAVLNTIKKKGLWKPAPAGKGIGLAIENFSRTVCAHIVEVSLDNSYNGFRVDKVTSVVHCGTVVNPHFGRGQIEGSIIWALSAAKYGGVEVKDGRVQRDNFHDNLLLRIDETPELDVHFIESDEPPSGLGEPGTPPLAPALLNALFNATGKRIRKIPVVKADLLAAAV
jgi:isoquinoline 1-oxidoreductase beta subunit